MNSKKNIKPWQVDQSQPYFYYDPDGGGFFYFSTETQRDEQANVAIKEYLHMDGWGEEVTSIVCGTMTGVATMVDKEYQKGVLDVYSCDEEGEYWDPNCLYRCNYVLKPLNHMEPV